MALLRHSLTIPCNLQSNAMSAKAQARSTPTPRSLSVSAAAHANSQYQSLKQESGEYELGSHQDALGMLSTRCHSVTPKFKFYWARSADVASLHPSVSSFFWGGRQSIIITNLLSVHVRGAITLGRLRGQCGRRCCAAGPDHVLEIIPNKAISEIAPTETFCGVGFRPPAIG